MDAAPTQRPRTEGGIAWYEVGEAYFARRTLARRAGTGSLWALGVGAVISGHYFGWNHGLAGGFTGLAIAGAIVALMYVGLAFSIAEMSSALPRAGGAHGFTRAVLGPWCGFIAGIGQTMATLVIAAMIAVGMGGYAGTLFVTPNAWDPLWWLVIYAVFIVLNVSGSVVALGTAVALSVAALAVIVIFCAGAAVHFSWAHVLSVVPAPGHGQVLPRGWSGVMLALPFAIWFLLLLETLPLASGDCREPARDMPRAVVLALVTLVPLALLVPLLNAGVAPGAASLAVTDEPLVRGLRTVLGDAAGQRTLALAMLAGLAASFHALLFACARSILSLSRGGDLPRWMSVVHVRRRVPQRALLVAAAVGLPIALAVRYSPFLFGGVPVGVALVHMAVFGALVSCVLQCAAYIALKAKRPGMRRPFASPMGSAGAWAALVAGVVILVSLCFEPGYRTGAIGAVMGYALALSYFAVWSRKRLVRVPEVDAVPEPAGAWAGKTRS